MTCLYCEELKTCMNTTSNVTSRLGLTNMETFGLIESSQKKSNFWYYRCLLRDQRGFPLIPNRVTEKGKVLTGIFQIENIIIITVITVIIISILLNEYALC